MNKYEILYIIDSSVVDEDKEKIVQSVKTLVEENGGNAQDPDRWGMRRFAYPINYKQEGYYVLMNFEADDALPKKVNDKLIIDKNIVRHMIIAK